MKVFIQWFYDIGIYIGGTLWVFVCIAQIENDDLQWMAYGIVFLLLMIFWKIDNVSSFVDALEDFLIKKGQKDGHDS